MVNITLIINNLQIVYKIYAFVTQVINNIKIYKSKIKYAYLLYNEEFNKILDIINNVSNYKKINIKEILSFFINLNRRKYINILFNILFRETSYEKKYNILDWIPISKIHKFL